jgi:hypothetical protein
MKHIVLTAEQAQVVLGADEPVEVRDPGGRIVAQLAPMSPADIDAVEQSRRHRGTGGPRVASAEVQAHLQRLAEIRQASGLDEATMLDLLRRMRAGEKV